MLRLVAASAVVAALATVGSAAAAIAPSVTTGPVTSVGPSSAGVSGSVNPNGASTTWYVEYGTSTSYGEKTSSTSAGSGTSTIAVSATLSGLAPGTSYHYRFVATNSGGTAHGADGLLTTSAAPQVVTGSPSQVTATSATLNGTVNPSSRATSWYFEYGTSTSYGSKTPSKDAGSGSSTVSVSAPVTGLTPARTYHFRLVATSDAGTSRGSDATFVPASEPTVTSEPASNVQDSSATLHGTANPNGAATTAYFEYGTTTAYGSKTSATSLGSGASAKDVSISASGLQAGTTYHFRLVASNASGTSQGADEAFTTTGPPAVQTGAVTGTSAGGATVTGSVDSRGHSTSWYFQYGPTPAYGLRTASHSQGASPGAHAVSEAIVGLDAATTYHVRLVASNSSGTSYGNDTTFATAGPAVTVDSSTSVVVHRAALNLSGKVASGRENESVTVFGRRFGRASFASIATVLTRPGGVWSLVVRPTIATTYEAIWNGSSSATVRVAVRPRVSIRALGDLRVAAHVASEHSLAGRVVRLQRRVDSGRWRTIAHARLGRTSSVVFRPSLPHGRSTLRVTISAGQAGGGYVAGFSRAVTVRRR